MKTGRLLVSTLAFLALSVSSLASPNAALAATGPLCYVDADATAGSDNGNSWANAYTDLQSALTDVACTEIWVAGGTYTPDGASPGDRTLSFWIQPGVSVYGGFGGDETALSQRDWILNPTTLSGQIGDPTSTDNSYHVVWMTGTGTHITSTTILDGFTISEGYADGGSTAHSRGPGLYCYGSGAGSICSPLLLNLVFSYNWADGSGGAIFNDGSYSGISSPALYDVTFEWNHAGGAGGAMANDGTENGTSSPGLTNVTFSNNFAASSGGGNGQQWCLGPKQPRVVQRHLL